MIALCLFVGCMCVVCVFCVMGACCGHVVGVLWACLDCGGVVVGLCGLGCACACLRLCVLVCDVMCLCCVCAACFL